MIGLSKCFRIYDTPQDRLKQSLWCGGRRYYREFWALRELSFATQRGEALAVIGRNGSGKSTFAADLWNPRASSGSVTIRGRVAALLELGSGFNPEFSGRENVFLNASCWVCRSNRPLNDWMTFSRSPTSVSSLTSLSRPTPADATALGICCDHSS